MKQAGLKLSDVRGKVAKIGYLEVALEPGATCAAGAIREGSKYVDTRTTITSVREQGSNREALVKWVEVPFTVQDEMPYAYFELFSKPVRQGRNLWWEVYRKEDEPGEEMEGKWNGERSLAVHLKPGLGHVPLWHYVGGAKMKLVVPGRRSCHRCLQAVGECRGGGIWNSCEASGTARGNWMEEQEKFLKRVGSSMEQQKTLEMELKEVEEGPDNDEFDVQMKAEAEKMEAAEEIKAKMMQKVPIGKIGGGIHLKNFPEGTGDKKKEKREALLTVIATCADLTQEEQERLLGADVTVTKPEKGRKGTVDVKIKLNLADDLMRKVWSHLERACKEEGVKSYQIEASTPASPVKEKPKTELQRARLRVLELLKAEEDRLAKEAEEFKKKKLETQTPPKEMDIGDLDRDDTTLPPLVLPTVPAEVPVLQDTADQVIEVAPTKGTNTAENNGQPGANNTETQRVTEQRWTPPEGKRRCEGQCQGCQRKCEEQGIEDCHYCYLNKIRGNKTNGCCNREECTNPKPVMKKIGKNKTEKRSKTLGDSLFEDILDRSPSAISKVGKQLVTFHPGQVESLAKNLESKGLAEKEGDAESEGKKRRHVGDTPPDQKRISKMPTLKKEVEGSKQQLPARTSSLIN